MPSFCAIFFIIALMSLLEKKMESEGHETDDHPSLGLSRRPIPRLQLQFTADEQHYASSPAPLLSHHDNHIRTVEGSSSSTRSYTVLNSGCNQYDGGLASVAATAGSVSTAQLPKETYWKDVSFHSVGNKRKITVDGKRQHPPFSSLQLGDKAFSLCSKDTAFFSKGKHIDKDDASPRCVKPTHDDVIKAIGKKLFWKARNTIIHQQRVFSFQVFELHRLIKVQKHILKRPKPSCKSSIFHDLNPSTRFPARNMLLLPNALDSDSKPVDSRVNSFSAFSSDTRPQPWYLHSPYEGPWLAPVRSPSEGQVYRPYNGPVFPALRFMNTAPYGSHDHLSNGAPASTSNDAGPYHSSSVSHCYLQGYSMPLFGTNETRLEPKKTSCVLEISSGKTTSQESAPVSDYQEDSCRPAGENESTGNPMDPLQGGATAALSLFPTIPSAGGLKNSTSKPDAQVVRVVPHNRNLALESAKRILESIQEERSSKPHQLR